MTTKNKDKCDAREYKVRAFYISKNDATKQRAFEIIVNANPPVEGHLELERDLFSDFNAFEAMLSTVMPDSSSHVLKLVVPEMFCEFGGAIVCVLDQFARAARGVVKKMFFHNEGFAQATVIVGGLMPSDAPYPQELHLHKGIGEPFMYHHSWACEFGFGHIRMRTDVVKAVAEEKANQDAAASAPAEEKPEASSPTAGKVAAEGKGPAEEKMLAKMTGKRVRDSDDE